MELEEERISFAQRQLAVGIDGANGRRIDELAASHRHAELDDLDDRIDRRFGILETDDGRRNGLGLRVKPDRHLGDHAERAFGTDEEPRQIVAGR